MNLSAILKIIETECCTRISIEALHPAFADCEELQMTPEQPLHHSHFCRSKKLADNNRRCAMNKRRSLEIASRGRSFCGKCPFGVRELAVPVMFQHKLAAVCYFTLLPGSAALTELRARGRWLAEFIRLVLAADGGNSSTSRRNTPEYYRKRILFFFDLHYMENISETDLADELGLNVNYFSTLFKKVTGKSFRQMLNERRIHEAKIYLRLHTGLRISYIARLCGFTDSNYFSTIFRRATGMSPKRYRFELLAAAEGE